MINTSSSTYNHNITPTITTTTTTTEATSFIDIFRVLIIRNCILSTTSCNGSCYCTRGKEIIKHLKNWIVTPTHYGLREPRPSFVISQFQLPWDFVKHYLPNSDGIGHEILNIGINSFAEKRNANFTMFERLLEWAFHSQITDFEPSNKLFDKAAENGNLQLVQFLHYNYPHLICTLDTINRSASNGHLDIIKFLIETRKENYDHQSIVNASRKGHLSCIKYLYNENQHLITSRPFRIEYIKLAFGKSIRSGNVDTVRYFLSLPSSFKCEADDLYEAAKEGHLEVIKFIIEQHLIQPDDEMILEAIKFASYHDHWSVIEYFISQLSDTIPSDRIRSLVIKAAEACRLDLVKVMNDKFNIDDIDKDYLDMMYDLVVSNGRLDILQYLLDNNYKCTSYFIERVTYYYQLDMFRFLLQHCGSQFNTKFLLCQAAKIGSLEDVKYLHQYILDHPNCLLEGEEKDYSYFPLDLASFNDNLELIKYLDENTTYGATTKAMDNAASYGNFKIVEYLHQNRSEGCSSAAFLNSCVNQHTEVFEFLCSHYKDVAPPEDYKSYLYQTTFSNDIKMMSLVYNFCLNSPPYPGQTFTFGNEEVESVLNWELIKNIHKQGVLHLPSALFGVDPIKWLVYNSMKQQRFDIFEWFHQNYKFILSPNDHPIDIQHEFLLNIKITQYLYENHHQYHDIPKKSFKKIVCDIVRLGNIEVVEYLISRFNLWSDRIFIATLIQEAIIKEYNYLYTIKLLSNKLDEQQQQQQQSVENEEKIATIIQKAIAKATNYGHLSILTFLGDKYCLNSKKKKLMFQGPRDLENCIDNGYVPVLKYLHHNLGIDIFHRHIVIYMNREKKYFPLINSCYSFYLSTLSHQQSK